MLKDLLVDNGAQVVRVGHKEVLLALRQELVKHARVHERVVEVTMARGVPLGLVVRRGARKREESLLVDTGVARLVEGGNAELLVSVLLDDAKGVVMGVEGGHKDEGNIDAVSRVQVLDLAHGEVEEGHVVLDLERALCTGHTCCMTSWRVRHTKKKAYTHPSKSPGHHSP